MCEILIKQNSDLGQGKDKRNFGEAVSLTWKLVAIPVKPVYSTKIAISVVMFFH